MYTGEKGMEKNDMLELARETRKKIREVFTDKVDTITAYDINDEPNRHTFKLNFRVYNFAGVKFQYENDFFEIYLFLNGEEGLLLSKPNSRYSEISDWDAYLKEIMVKIESYIPEKYLKAKGWR